MIKSKGAFKYSRILKNQRLDLFSSSSGGMFSVDDGVHISRTGRIPKMSITVAHAHPPCQYRPKAVVKGKIYATKYFKSFIFNRLMKK
jgi:hypothetical protein